MKQLTSLLLGLLLLSGCSTYSEDEIQLFDTKIVKYLEEKNHKCVRSESGVHYEILEEGEGNLIQFRDIVSFTYTGSLLDGTVFDEQLDAPVEFPVSQLIGAWKEIMFRLKKGGKAFLVAPPQMGYGDRKLDDIPENSVLVFELEVVDVK